MPAKYSFSHLFSIVFGEASPCKPVGALYNVWIEKRFPGLRGAFLGPPGL